LFNWNQGGIARAEAQWERAERQLATVRDRAALEVREAFVRLCQAEEDLRTWQKDIRPVVEDALARAEKAYKQGEASQLLVLETTRHLLEARLREVQLQAEVRRARAELERSVGRRLTSPDPGGPILEWPKEGPTP
jgi:cobalt-zinc-cadmium efflux system outer membrane protein